MHEVNIRRQALTRQIRKQHLKQLFANKRSKGWSINDQNRKHLELERINTLIVNINQSTQQDHLQLLNKFPLHITVFPSSTVLILTKLCLTYWKKYPNSSLQGLIQISSLDMLTWKQYPQILNLLNQHFLTNIVGSIINAQQEEHLTNLTYLFGNLIIDYLKMNKQQQYTQFIIRNVEQVLDTLIKNLPAKLQQSKKNWTIINWITKNVFLTVNNAEIVRKTGFGNIAAKINTGLINKFQQSIFCKQETIQKENLIQKIALVNESLEIVNLFISAKAIQQTIVLHLLDTFILNYITYINQHFEHFFFLPSQQSKVMQDLSQQSRYSIYMPLSIQVVETALFLVQQLQCQKGINKLFEAICKGIFLTDNSFVFLLHYQKKFKNNETGTLINQFFQTSLPKIIYSPLVAVRAQLRSYLTKFLLNNLDKINKIQFICLMNLIQLTSIDGRIQNVQQGLYILEYYLNDLDIGNQDTISMMTNILQDIGFVKILCDMQLHQNLQIYEKATNILELLNIEN